MATRDKDSDIIVCAFREYCGKRLRVLEFFDSLDVFHSCLTHGVIPIEEHLVIRNRIKSDRISLRVSEYRRITGSRDLLERDLKLVQVIAGFVLFSITKIQLMRAGEDDEHLTLMLSGRGRGSDCSYKE